MALSTFEVALALLLASLVGALPPLARRWSERGLHLLVAASAGVFLGLVGLHLVPELAEPPPPGASPLSPWLACLAGFLVLFVVGRLVLPNHHASADPRAAHSALWISTVVGLSVHALAAGLGFAALLGRVEVEWLVLLPLLWHKLTEGFSLAAVLRLGDLRRRRATMVLVAFALVTPVGFLLGTGLEDSGPGVERALTGFAAGTFLFVALADLLPEVFHGSGRRWPRLAALAIGVALSSPDPEHLRVAGALGREVLAAAWAMTVEMAPWLLFGFLAAGLIAQWLSAAWLGRHLSGESPRAVGLASLLGAPLPLCSCSVLPVASQLRRAGAGRGPTSAFLVATPETGVDSVAVTWGLLGPAFALLRAVAAVLSGVVTGLLVAMLGGRARVDEREDEPPPAPSCCGPATATCCSPPPAEVALPAVDSPTSACDDGCAPPAPAGAARPSLPVRVLRYAVFELADDLAGPLLLGILLSGALTAVLPPDVLDHPAARGPLGALIVLAIGIPIYVCASASTPVAATLIAKGLSPGAALVFLLAGPATNLASLTVLARTLGKRAVAVHLVALAAVSLALGAALDLLWPAIPITMPEAGLHAHGHGWLGTASAALLLMLLAFAWLRRVRRRFA